MARHVLPARGPCVGAASTLIRGIGLSKYLHAPHVLSAGRNAFRGLQGRPRLMPKTMLSKHGRAPHLDDTFYKISDQAHFSFHKNLTVSQGARIVVPAGHTVVVQEIDTARRSPESGSPHAPSVNV